MSMHGSNNSNSNGNNTIIAAWNPSNQSEFIVSTSIVSTNVTANCNNDKLQLFNMVSIQSSMNSNLVNINDSDNVLKVPDLQQLKEVQSWNVSQISCLEWRPAMNSAPFLAYGTNLGYTYLLQLRNYEKSIIHSPVKSGKRPCSALSWNKKNTSQLAAGFENLKSEYCSIIWDLEYERYFKTSFGESSCSLGWLSDNASTLAVGTSMGWVKVYDTRSNNQQAATYSILAHPAPRPRKIKGIRPDPFNLNLFATFSDFPGDAIKIWDLRKATTTITTNNNTTNTTNKSNQVHPLSTINPRTSLSTEAVIDVAWSPTRPSLIAVATSLQKSISFFSTASASHHPVLTSGTTTSSIPIYTTAITEPVKSMSWQGYEARCNLTILQQQQQAQLDDSLNTPFNNKLSALSTISSSWEGFQGDDLLTTSLSTLRDCQQNNTSSQNLNLTSKQNRININSISTICTNKLLIATPGNFIELLPREQIPLSISSSGILSTGYGHHPVLISNICVSSKVVSLPDVVVVNCSYDICSLMRQRCVAGYSADACSNIDVLADELDKFYTLDNEYKIENSSANSSNSNRYKDFEIFVTNTKAAYKIWVWMDRFETTITDRNLTLANCGVINILKNTSEFSYKDNQMPKYIKLFHRTLGCNIYCSEKREVSKKVCGWIKVFGLENIESHKGSQEEDGADDIDLLEVIVDELYLDSFERAAAIALWHGRLDLSVNVLCRAIKFVEDHLQQNKATHIDVVEWDVPMTIPGYLQTIQLVAMCFAGYNFPVITNVSQSKSTEGDYEISRITTCSTWSNMCKQVVQQLQLYSARTSSAYLIAACNFLLDNIQNAMFPLEHSESIGVTLLSYSDIINDPRLSLEDRIAFSCTYLSDLGLQQWLIDTQLLCLKEGRLEGLILTGLAIEGLQILQQYINIYHDVQTVALIVSRIVDSDSTTVEGSGSNQLTTKSISSENFNSPSQEWIWLHEYRSLLNKWELFIERAYLDVELGKRYRRKISNDIALLSNASKGVIKKALNNTATPGKLKHPSNKNGNKLHRMMYRIPVHSDYPHFYLRCGYCGNTLPVDGMQNVRPEYLRTQKNVLNCCAACSKQLPRCYVCQLYMGMVNPYLELNRVMTQKRLSADRLLGSSNNSPSIAGTSSTSAQDFGTNNLGTHALIDEDEEIEHNTIFFGKWFFFCQHCRHGGHAQCIDQWFGRSGDIECHELSSICKRTICGVNGCECHCVLRI